MTYDNEYNSFRFNGTEVEILLNALSYVSWNDKGLTNGDKKKIRDMYNILDGANYENRSYSNVTADL